jgi:ABC-type transport system substrate-binding protein
MAHRSPATRTVVALSVALALLAAACGSAATSKSGAARSGTASTVGADTVVYHDVLRSDGGTPKRGGSLVYAIEGEADGWNPTSARWTEPALTEANTVFDPLAAWGTHYDVEPYLAQSITHSSDYREWDIKLRPHVTFQDGEPLDAAALKLDLDMVKASALAGSSLGPVTGFSVVDPLTVAVHMSMPWTAFPAVLTAQDGMIAAPKQLKANDTQHPIGTGPFVFSSWTPNSTFVVHRNPNYWRAGLPYLDQVTFKPIVEQTTMYESLVNGDVDMLSTSIVLIQNKLVTDAAHGQIQLVYSRGETEENLTMLNTAAAPFNDLRVRQALAYATDTASWAKTVGIDPRTLADGPFAPGSKWYIPTGYPKYDLAKARSLVQQVQAEHGPVRFTLQCTADTVVAQTCQILQAQWDKAGMQVAIKTVDEPTLIANAVGGAFQADIWRQFGEQDPDGDFVWWDSSTSNPPLALNMARNRDPLLDAALYNGRTTDKEYERKLDYITVARRLAVDLPYIWLNHTVWVVGANNNVRGFDQTTLPDGTKTDPVTSGVERLGQIWLAS